MRGRVRRTTLHIVLCVAVLLSSARAAADEVADDVPAETPAVEDQATEDPVSEDPATERGRQAFLQGTELARNEQWREALAAFERASALRAHPVVTYNIAFCERALGRYTRARHAFLAAVATHEEGSEGKLPDDMFRSVRGYLGELDGLIARVTITLQPADAAIAIDGRPLATADPAASPPLLTAGVKPAADPQRPIAASFVLLVDPGTHTIVLQKDGLPDEVIPARFTAGEVGAMTLTMPPPRRPESAPPSLPSAPMAPAEPPMSPGYGYALLGVGAASLVVGAVTGIAHLVNLDELEDVCVDKACPSDRAGQIERTDALGTTSLVMLPVGAVAMGVGGYLLSLAGDDEQAAVRPVVGWGVVGVEGSF
jgi:hypothetical protein